MSAAQFACFELRELAERLKLRERAVESGMRWASDRSNLPPDVSPSGVELRFRSLSVCVRNSDLTQPYFSVRCEILAAEIGIGSYTLITTLEGENEDDYWIIDSEKC